ncbi:hypothetical protein M433DRAFT_66812 [Acidomyces richmondensis BFW]|nr:hypothetical protein M433DRAFT_66812 [Acidomyces richmondensis BFW]
MFCGFDLTTARDMILDVACNKIDGESIILHAFSNGGATTSIRLCEGLIEKLPGRKFFDKVILDCCPGTTDLKSATRAIAFSLPTYPLARNAAAWIIWLALISYMIVRGVMRIENGIDKLRCQLNEAAIFPLNVPRIYISSRADRLVEWRHVHSHTENARQRGYHNVKELQFEHAPHCAFLQEDPEE